MHLENRELASLLERYDQTEPALQRQIVGRFVEDRTRLRDAMDELVSAIDDAQRRYLAGDMRALESTMLAATLRQAKALQAAVK
jgi:hypothetical protein